MRISSTYNHSDNDYWMNNVPAEDDLGNVTGTQRVKRFHDDYRGGLVKIKAGILEQPLADELSLGLTIAGNHNSEQHPDYSINKVFGGLHTSNTSKLASLVYKKAWKEISLTGYLLAGEIKENYYDTLNRNYKWDGTYTIPKNPSDGELDSQSIFRLKDNIVRSNLSAQYKLSEQQKLNLSYSSNYLKRHGFDEINKNNVAFNAPNWIKKSVSSLGFSQALWQDSLQVALFTKHYQFSGLINAEQLVNFELVDVTTPVNFSDNGFGSSLSYKVNQDWLIKSSFEKSVRLPEAVEILGTGKYVLPNPNLSPENSRNYNLGLIYNATFENYTLNWESSLFHRDSENFIRYVSDVIFGQYLNTLRVETAGLESALHVSLFDDYSITTNITYQEAINASAYDIEGRKDVHYKDKIPNQPGLFANLRLGANWRYLPGLSSYWTAQYTRAFYYNWENSGLKNNKYVVPSQLTHDLTFEHDFNSDNYMLSLSVRNLFDAETFDNFNIEKPGRAYYLKFRYLY